MVVGNGRRGWGWACGGLVVLALFLALAFSPVQAVRAASLSATNCLDDGSAGSLRTVIAGATAGDTITFAQDCNPITLASVLTIGKTLTIDGTGHTVTISGGSTTRLFFVNGNATAVMNGLTLTGGYVNDGTYGGGIYNGGTLTVTNSTLSGNFANNSGGGGGILNDGPLTLVNTTISGNSASDGAGIFNRAGGTVNVTNSTLSGNTGGSGGSGGGIYNTAGGKVTVTNSTLSGNSTSNLGGNGSGGRGGGIYNGGTLTVTNSIVSGNYAPYSGGGIHNSAGGTVTLRNSTISGNSGPYEGRGIYNLGTVNATNTLIVNNGTSPYGEVSPNGLSGTSTHNLTGPFTLATPLQNNGGPTQTLAIPTPATPTATDAYQQGDLATCNAITPGGTPQGVYDQRGAPAWWAAHAALGHTNPAP